MWDEHSCPSPLTLILVLGFVAGCFLCLSGPLSRQSQTKTGGVVLLDDRLVLGPPIFPHRHKSQIILIPHRLSRPAGAIQTPSPPPRWTHRCVIR